MRLAFFAELSSHSFTSRFIQVFVLILPSLASVLALEVSGCVCGTLAPSEGFVPFVGGPDLLVRVFVTECPVVTSSLLLAVEPIGRQCPSLV